MRIQEAVSSISDDTLKKVVKNNEFRLRMILRQNGVISKIF